MRPLKIIKNRSDIGAGTRGSDIGIDALEIAAINSNNDFFNKHLFDIAHPGGVDRGFRQLV